MYTLVESAKANGLEPCAYLQALFERYPLATTREERRLLLPMFIKLSGLAGLGETCCLLNAYPTDEGWLYLASMIDLYNRQDDWLRNEL